jgi:hypothetical protein
MDALERFRLRCQAWRRPRMFFRCTGCGSGPWHNSWAWIEDGRDLKGNMIHRMPKKPLGGCCSGAD